MVDDDRNTGNIRHPEEMARASLRLTSNRHLVWKQHQKNNDRPLTEVEVKKLSVFYLPLPVEHEFSRNPCSEPGLSKLCFFPGKGARFGCTRSRLAEDGCGFDNWTAVSAQLAREDEDSRRQGRVMICPARSLLEDVLQTKLENPWIFRREDLRKCTVNLGVIRSVQVWMVENVESLSTKI
jgi:hypothetical protein